MRSLVKSILALSVVSMVGVGCTDDAKKIEDPIAASDKHEFTVDEEGKVQFKLEIVYFKFDDFTLTQEGMDRLNALAAYMKKNPEKSLQIEGHCDDRGTVEYNLALGHMRAQSVRNYLSTLNVEEARLKAISFGKEKPAAVGEGESAWSQNRRAEFAFVD